MTSEKTCGPRRRETEMVQTAVVPAMHATPAERETPDAGAIIEQVITKGDLSAMQPAERARYYVQVCRSIGVNPLTQPFQYITLNNRLTLYATRGCTDQLRERRKITAHVVSRERMDDVYIVTVRVTIHPGTPDERSDEAIGAVSIGGLKGDFLANALMKAETKGKRRATLSLIGLGWLDEGEVETIPGAMVRPIDPAESSAAEGLDLPEGVRSLDVAHQAIYRRLRDEIAAADTLEELQEAWATVQAHDKLHAVVLKHLVNDKDTAKAEIQAAESAPSDALPTDETAEPF